MTVGEIESVVKSVLVTVLDNRCTVDDISSDADLVQDYGLDSLQTIALLLGIEDALDLELDYDNLELAHLRSVRVFASFLSGLLATAS
jgi:acyl carrier protein